MGPSWLGLVGAAAYKLELESCIPARAPGVAASGHADFIAGSGRVRRCSCAIYNEKRGAMPN